MKQQKLKECFDSLDRSFFLDDDMKEYADLDMPLPIGFGDNLTAQPCAGMTQLLAPKKDSRVLKSGLVRVFRPPCWPKQRQKSTRLNGLKS